MPVLGTCMLDPYILVFHGLMVSAIIIYIIYSRLNPVLNMTSLPGLITFKQHDGAAWPNRKRHDRMSCVAARTSMVQEYKPVSLSAFPIKVFFSARLTLS